MSERTLRRRVADGKIEAVKDATRETGVAWFIEQATVDALSQSALREEEQKEVEPVESSAPAPVESELPAELVQLRGEVRGIKAFLVGQVMAENSEQPVADLGTLIGQAIREGMAPVMERIEQQSAENALLKQQVIEALDRATQAEAREREQAVRRQSKAPWAFPRRRQ
jgi:hypothetical protein